MAEPALLVNLRSHLSQAGDTTLAGGSLLILEFVGTPELTTREEGSRLVLAFSGAALNMPAGTYPVYDSLVNTVVVREEGSQVLVGVERDLIGPWVVNKEEALIRRFTLYLDPAPLKPVFGEKVVLLDPWARPKVFSPTQLPEGLPTRDIAARLGRLLSAAGARPHLVNGGPLPVLTPAAVRSGRRCDAVLGIATAHAPRHPYSGLAVKRRPGDPTSLRLARLLAAEITRKLPLPLVAEVEAADRLLREIPAPGALVEVGCLSHRVDEGLLRDIDFKQKVAQTLFNALKHFFAGSGAV
ncbi:MAG TPA: N-acetylmuramoyl-L-alanine amidase [Firmicutes bacterium]|nr:N-acetylmuramoyl-L-alanine amidase [Bacillota bacterium]